MHKWNWTLLLLMPSTLLAAEDRRRDCVAMVASAAAQKRDVPRADLEEVCNTLYERNGWEKAAPAVKRLAPRTGERVTADVLANALSMCPWKASLVAPLADSIKDPVARDFALLRAEPDARARVAAASRILEKDPSHRRARAFLVADLLEAGDPERTQPHLAQLGKDAATHIEHALLGMALAEVGPPAEALAVINDILEHLGLPPDRAEVRDGGGWPHTGMRDLGCAKVRALLRADRETDARSVMKPAWCADAYALTAATHGEDFDLVLQGRKSSNPRVMEAVTTAAERLGATALVTSMRRRMNQVCERSANSRCVERPVVEEKPGPEWKFTGERLKAYVEQERATARGKPGNDDGSPLKGKGKTVYTSTLDGARLHVVVSRALDPTGEATRGAYVAAFKRAGQPWEGPFYLGVADRYPYVVDARDVLPVFDAQGALLLPVEVAELDPASITYPPLNRKSLRTAPNRVLAFDVEKLRKDTDGDGLTDLVEERVGTDASKPDTDGDGMSDLVDPVPLVADGEPLPFEELLLGGWSSRSRKGVHALETSPSQAAPLASPGFLEGNTRCVESEVPLFRRGSARFRVVELTADQVSALRPRFGNFLCTRFSTPVRSKDGNRVLVDYSETWEGGSWLFTRTPEGWTVEVVGSWIT
jgi:hypothetical protein